MERVKKYKLDKGVRMEHKEPILVGKPEEPKQADMRMPFGKYGPKDGKPGTLICDLPDSYLIWILEQDFITKNKKLFDQLKIENKYRNRWKR